jgi:hypothetical protein
LRDWGWQPSATKESGGVLVTTTRCLFGDLIPESNGRCCALEEGLLTGLVQTMVNGHAKVARAEGCHLDVVL